MHGKQEVRFPRQNVSCWLYRIQGDPQTCNNGIKYYKLIYIPEPTGRNTPEYRSISLDSDFWILQSPVRFLPPCDDITAGTRLPLASLFQPVRRRERWAWHICQEDISLGLTKVEARVKMSSNSVPISSVMPTPRVCSVTIRLQRT